MRHTESSVSSHSAYKYELILPDRYANQLVIRLRVVLKMIAFYGHAPYFGGNICIKSCQNTSYSTQRSYPPRTHSGQQKILDAFRYSYVTFDVK
jgi:hypothetical protein